MGSEGDNLVLVVGTYSDPGAAADDFETLKSGEDADEYKVVGAVVMNRDASGKVEVQEHGDKTVSHGAEAGAVVGIVVGLFAPPLLAATAIGAGIGAGIGASRNATTRSSSASRSTSTCRPDPPPSSRSSTTNGPTRSRRPWSRRTSESTRRSIPTTTTSCRKQSRSPHRKSRPRSTRSVAERRVTPEGKGAFVTLAYDYPFLDVLWTMIIFFAFVIWIWLLIMVLADNFMRHDHSGWAKAGWTIFVIFLPLIGVLIYMIARPPEAETLMTRSPAG